MLYVERPVFLDDVRRPALDCTEPMPGIHRIVPRLPVMYATIEHAAQMMVRTLLLEWIDANAECRARFESPIQWYGTATPAPVMLDAFDARAIVYDRVTDEDLEDQTRASVDDAVHRSERPGTAATDTHHQRCLGERLLLAHADIVFSTGRTLSEKTQACWERMVAEMLCLARLPFRTA